MATQACLVANPTSADITINSKTAVAGQPTLLNLEDTPGAAVVAEAMLFMAQGCAILRNNIGTESQRQQAGYQLHLEEYVA